MLCLHTCSSCCHQTWPQLKQKRALHPPRWLRAVGNQSYLAAAGGRTPRSSLRPRRLSRHGELEEGAGAGGRQCLERSQSIAQCSSVETEVCDSAAHCAGSCQKPNCTICQINIPIFNISFKRETLRGERREKYHTTALIRFLSSARHRVCFFPVVPRSILSPEVQGCWGEGREMHC